MAKVKTAPFDAAKYLETPEDIAIYMDEIFRGAMEDRDPGLITKALGNIARSKGMAAIAEASGQSRETLYRTLSEKGNPKLDTLLDVMSALGLRLTVAPIENADRCVEVA